MDIQELNDQKKQLGISTNFFHHLLLMLTGLK
ncbi:hypothetical protein O204_22455 [Pseudomonas simiae]|uniref:Uncharacterized protein n=1 Tax=Pseudomonas simiae TaxID=321846 RepID=U1UTY2_9PSED|nr:hypothetical protein O204_22455 [Pseudomonas simiae]